MKWNSSNARREQHWYEIRRSSFVKRRSPFARVSALLIVPLTNCLHM